MAGRSTAPAGDVVLIDTRIGSSDITRTYVFGGDPGAPGLGGRRAHRGLQAAGPASPAGGRRGAASLEGRPRLQPAGCRTAPATASASISMKGPIW
jgi:hypothetical protein